MPVPLPDAWTARVATYLADGGPSGSDWVPTVPGLLADALEMWDLTVTGEPRTGWTAVVVPVERDGEPLALKVGWPHTEMQHEHLALRVWAGHGAVRLVAAEPRRGLLLLERLDSGRDLLPLGIDEACRIAGGLLARLNVPAPPQFMRITDYLPPHLERMAGRAAVPRRLNERVQGLARELLTDPGPALLLHTDLHYENILGGTREPWLAIDPKPVAGHPGFEVLPLLQNRMEEIPRGTVRAAIRRRVAIVAEAAGIDEDAALAWTLLRAGLEVSWASALGDDTELTRYLTLAKAVDD
jgi:streptomycin 6-kinase